MNKHRIGALVAAAALTLTFAGTAFAAEFAWQRQRLPERDLRRTRTTETAL